MTSHGAEVATRSRASLDRSRVERGELGNRGGWGARRRSAVAIGSVASIGRRSAVRGGRRRRRRNGEEERKEEEDFGKKGEKREGEVGCGLVRGERGKFCEMVTDGT